MNLLQRKIINPLAYRLGYLHYENTIGGTLSGDAHTVGALVDGYLVFPGDEGDLRGIHVKFTGTVVDPDGPDDEDEQAWRRDNS